MEFRNRKTCGFLVNPPTHAYGVHLQRIAQNSCTEKTPEDLHCGCWSVPGGEFGQEEIMLPVDYDLSMLPTWALIEELKNRTGVTFRANTTTDGLVGTFEHAPAMVFTVKLPIEEGEK